MRWFFFEINHLSILKNPTITLKKLLVNIICTQTPLTSSKSILGLTSFSFKLEKFSMETFFHISTLYLFSLTIYNSWPNDSTEDRSTMLKLFLQWHEVSYEKVSTRAIKEPGLGLKSMDIYPTGPDLVLASDPFIRT